MSQHAVDFRAVVDAAGLHTFDVAGFSFGARVALAATAAVASLPVHNRPYRVRKLCLTGVAADRGPLGRLALEGWRASLQHGDLEGFVWQLILSTHSPNYLAAQESSVRSWVDAVVAANSIQGLRGIVQQTHTDEPDDPSHPLTLAKVILAGGGVEDGMVIAGADDVIAPPAEALRLASAAGWRYVSIKGAAHAIPIEQAIRWRREVLTFLAACGAE